MQPCNGDLEIKTPLARWKYRHALRFLGLPHDYRMRTEQDLEFALHVYKEQVIDARRANNDDRAAVLSLCQQILKRRYYLVTHSHCPHCGAAKTPDADHCQVCYITKRFYKTAMQESTVKDYEMTFDVPVPPRTHVTGELSRALQKMADEGQVGDSFVTPKAPTSIKLQAKFIGLEIICRNATLNVIDKKKRKYRVWRSDGYDEERVNEIIELRKAGKLDKIPKPKKCVPMTPEEKAKKKHR